MTQKKQAVERRLADGDNIQKNIKDENQLCAGVLAKMVSLPLKMQNSLPDLKHVRTKKKQSS